MFPTSFGILPRWTLLLPVKQHCSNSPFSPANLFQADMGVCKECSTDTTITTDYQIETIIAACTKTYVLPYINTLTKIGQTKIKALFFPKQWEEKCFRPAGTDEGCGVRLQDRSIHIRE